MTLPVEILLPLLPKTSTRDFVELGERSEELGYSGVWAPETTGPDGISILAALAAQTERIRLGSGILPIFMRSPVAMAQTVAALDSPSGGRFILGLGTSSRTVVESWHGMPFGAQLTAMREYCTIVRQALSGEQTNFQGKVFSSRGFQLSCLPPDPCPPIFVAALNPPMVRLAGEIADGIILNWVVPERVKMPLGQIDEGGSKADRSTRPIVASVVWAAVDEDTPELRRWLRSNISGYMFAMEPYRRAIRDNGFATAVQQLEEAGARGDRDGVRNALPDELLEQITGLAHITGGGIKENLNRILPANVDAAIDLSAYQVNPVFAIIQQQGAVSDEHMLRTFNLGIGLAAVCRKSHVAEVVSHLQTCAETVYPTGEIVPGQAEVLCQGSVRYA